MLHLQGIIGRQATAHKQPHAIHKAQLFCFLLMTCLSTICSVSLPYIALASNNEANSEFYLPDNLLSGTETYDIAAFDATATEKAQADVICDGNADQVEINAALTARYKHILLSSGTFVISAQIVLASNIWLQGQGAGTIIKIGGDYSGIKGIGCTNFALSDFVVDGDNKNTGLGSHSIVIRVGCSNFTVRNLRLVNSHSFSLMVDSANWGSIDNIYCSSSGEAFHDGVHLHECSNMAVSNIQGSTGDDLFAIDSTSAASSYITVTNIVGTSATAQLCRIWIADGASVGADISDISISGISGTGNRLVYIASDVNGTISRVNVSNVTGVGVTNLIWADTTAGGAISDLNIDGFNVSGSSAYGVFICGVTGGALTNGSILNCSDHSLVLRANVTFKCDTVNIKTKFAKQMGVSIDNTNDLILNNIISDVTGYAFWFAATASTKVKMTSCKAITPVTGIQHNVDLTNSIIANNDLSNATTKVAGAGLFTDVLIQNNVGYMDPSEVRIGRVTTSSRTMSGGMRDSLE